MIRIFIAMLFAIVLVLLCIAWIRSLSLHEGYVDNRFYSHWEIGYANGVLMWEQSETRVQPDFPGIPPQASDFFSERHALWNTEAKMARDVGIDMPFIEDRYSGTGYESEVVPWPGGGSTTVTRFRVHFCWPVLVVVLIEVALLYGPVRRRLRNRKGLVETGDDC